MTEKIKKLCNSCKDMVSAFINWEKDSVLVFLLKLALVIGGIYLAVTLLPYLLGVLLIVLLIRWEKSEVAYPQTQFAPLDEQSAREILTIVLKENAAVLDIVPPSTVDCITPTRYSVVQSEAGAVFYRFIVQTLPDKSYDFKYMQNVLNTKIQQKVQAGYLNLPASVYDNMNSFLLVNSGDDIYHEHNIFLDIVPVTNKIQAEYVNGMLITGCCLLPDDFHLFDEDF